MYDTGGGGKKFGRTATGGGGGGTATGAGAGGSRTAGLLMFTEAGFTGATPGSFEIIFARKPSLSAIYSTILVCPSLPLIPYAPILFPKISPDSRRKVAPEG